MAHYWKEEKSYDRSKYLETPSEFYSGNASPSKQSYEEFNSIKALEFREMQEEEKYIQGLRMQREKIEQFIKEVAKKDKRIKELEAQLYESKMQTGERDRMALEISRLQNELNNKDYENEELRQGMRKQMEEYEYSLQELHQVMLREREDKAKEIRNLKAQLSEKDQETTYSYSEVEKIKKQMKLLEEKLNMEIKASKDKDKQANEQVKTWKNFEKMLKDQVTELAHEKSIMENKLKEMRTYVENTETTVQKLPELEQSLNKEKRKSEELQKIIEQKNQELNSFKQANTQEKSQVEEELHSLQQELNRAIDLISRQETTIVNLRMRKQEDDNSISSLKDELSAKASENQRLHSQNQKLQQEIEDYYAKISSLEASNHSLRHENDNMEKQLRTYYEKEQQEKLERQHLAKLKADLINQRTDEINKLSKAIESFSYNNK